MTRPAHKQYLIVKERHLLAKLKYRPAATYFVAPLDVLEKLNQTRVELAALKTPYEEEVVC